MKCLLKFFINLIQICQRGLDIQGYWSASFVTVCEHLMERHSYHNYSKFGLKCKPFLMPLNQMCKIWRIGIHATPCVGLIWCGCPWKHFWMKFGFEAPSCWVAEYSKCFHSSYKDCKHLTDRHSCHTLCRSDLKC